MIIADYTNDRVIPLLANEERLRDTFGLDSCRLEEGEQWLALCSNQPVPLPSMK